jgi:GSH-dependent disulfide-bond oxidoreductase
MPRPSRTRAVKSAKSLTPKLATPKRVKSNGAKLTRAKLTRAKPTRAKPKRTEPTRASRSKLPIELYYWPTPNGWKISIMLEECGLPYVVRPVDISKGEQFSPEFLAISPNNRMPAIVDPNGPAGRPISVFESGAILQYLGRKTGQFYPREERARVAVDEWLFWQMGGLGPMAGQANHFRLYASEQIAYAIDRYTNEVNRLFGVMDTRLRISRRPLFRSRHGVCGLGAARRTHGARACAIPAPEALVRDRPRAAGGQARFRHPRRSRVRRRHEGSESARHPVRSDGAVSVCRMPGRAKRTRCGGAGIIRSGRGDVSELRWRN